MTYIANNIKNLRKAHLMNQEALAEDLGLSRSVIGSYEEGRANPSIATLIRLSEIFEVTIDSLVKTEIEGKRLYEPNTTFKTELNDINQRVERLQRIASEYFETPVKLQLTCNLNFKDL